MKGGAIVRWPGLTMPAVVLEKDIVAECIQTLQWAGWFCAQVENKKRVKRGFSDWVIIRAGRVIFLEFKRPGGRQSGAQVDFMDGIRSHGGEYRVAYCLDDIADLLKR